MDTEAAAVFLNVTEGRVRQLARAGELRGKKIGQRAWVFERDELERFKADEERQKWTRRRPKDSNPADDDMVN